MGNPATAEIVELKTRTDEYYKRAWQRVEDMGYINPSKDIEDKRSIELTKFIQSERLEVQVLEGWNMSNFAPRTAKYYSDFQSRVDGEDEISGMGGRQHQTNKHQQQHRHCGSSIASTSVITIRGPGGQQDGPKGPQ